MFDIYIYDQNWLTVGTMHRIVAAEVEDIKAKLKKSGFNVHAVEVL